MIDYGPLYLEFMFLPPRREGFLYDLAISDCTAGCGGGYLDCLLPIASSAGNIIKLSLNLNVLIF
jgi:hypothetical protein